MVARVKKSTEKSAMENTKAVRKAAKYAMNKTKAPGKLTKKQLGNTQSPAGKKCTATIPRGVSEHMKKALRSWGKN